MKWLQKGTALLLALILTLSTVTAAYGIDENSGVPLDNTEFPDAAFLAQVQEEDRDRDGRLSQEELDAVTELDLRKAGIQSLAGLQWFRNLETLNCSENDLETLVLPDLPRLTSLTCNENPNLTRLELSGAPALEHLYCFHSGLAELDLHAVPNLAYLAWGGSPLETLDLSGNPHLSWLHVLGGDLDRADLSQNTELDILMWNHTRIRELDLSSQTELTFLNCTDNQLVTLDLTNQKKLEAVYAGNNRLTAIRMPQGVDCLTDLGTQQPAAMTLPAGENSISLTQLAPWVTAEHLQEVQGAALAGDRLQLERPNQMVTYRYTDGSVLLNAALEVHGENGWKTPLTIQDWTYGQTPSLPRAEAAFGTVQFSYGADPGGPFQPEPPVQAGTWYVQALVEPSDDWSALKDTARFEIHPAMPSCPQPARKTAVYGDRLSVVSLEPGFLWESADAWVGDAGLQNHLASFVPADPVDYLTVEHIPVEVEVLPYDGTQLPIPHPANPAEAEHLVIRHGDWILQKGRDYVTQIASGQVTIQFRGNYTGTVTRSFPTPGGGSGSVQKDRLILLNPEHGTLDANPAAPSAGAMVHITLEPEPGYQAAGVTAVDQRGTVLPITRMDDGSYTFFMVRGTVTVTGTVRPRTCCRNYVDVSPESWYADAVGFMCRTGWMIGVDAEHFAPDAPLSRGMLMAILYRQAGSPPAGAPPFTDILQDAFYAEAVAWAAANGLTVGDGHAKFYPELPLTREELVTVLWRKAGSPHASAPGSYLDGFADGAQTAPWAADAWNWALAEGLVVGRSETQLAPKEPMTRAETAAVLTRQSAAGIGVKKEVFAAQIP